MGLPSAEVLQLAEWCRSVPISEGPTQAVPTKALRLHFAGRVEWGVPRRDSSLLRALRAIPETTTVADGPRSSRIEWVTPHLSAEVRALAWQPGRALRHAVLRGLWLNR